MSLSVSSSDAACPATESFPDWASGGWHYFRPHIEGLFARFFWSPDRRTFVAQMKSGETMELGAPLDARGDDSGLDFDGAAGHAIFRWNLVRRYDAHGLTNAIVYRWARLGARGLGYLTDIFDTQGPGAPLTSFGLYAHHARLAWERHDFALWNDAAIWRATPDLRLHQVDVTSMDSGAQSRRIVRRYHLAYYPSPHPDDIVGIYLHSFLKSVQVEGRCQNVTEDQTLTVPYTGCPGLPATTYSYSSARQEVSYAPTPVPLATDPPLWIPKNKGDAPDVAIVDVNGDGLPDIYQPADPRFTDFQQAHLYLQDPNQLSTRLTSVTMDFPLRGSGAATERTFLSSLSTASITIPGDWRGDAKLDAYWSNPSDGTQWRYWPVHGGQGIPGWSWAGEPIVQPSRAGRRWRRAARPHGVPLA